MGTAWNIAVHQGNSNKLLRKSIFVQHMLHPVCRKYFVKQWLSRTAAPTIQLFFVKVFVGNGVLDVRKLVLKKCIGIFGYCCSVAVTVNFKILIFKQTFYHIEHKRESNRIDDYAEINSDAHYIAEHTRKNHA